jgi:pimeloyl-ACP methyl ester carboxylesterase
VCFENPDTEKKFFLPYLKIGSGKKPAIAFHGFGQESASFNCFAPVLDTEYTMYSFDLPYHGKADLEKSEHPAECMALKTFFLNFLESENIKTFACIGFSIGARLSLVLLELFTDKIESMILIAPDGFRLNIWYKLATGSRLTRAIFKHIIYNPDLFFWLTGIMVRLRFVHPGVSRFAISQMSSLLKRERVYYTWMFFRKIHFSKRRILSNLLRNNISTSIYLGSEDKIIQPKQFDFLVKTPETNCKIILLPAGHNDLIEETARYLGKMR